MRRLTLILSDLYLPPDAVLAPLATPLELRGLSSLLRFASVSPLTEWRPWLARETGHGVLAGFPPAQVAALARVPAQAASTAWFATPVHLSARLDHVRLIDRGLLTLPDEERPALCADFTRQFGPDLQLHAGGARDLLLTGLPAGEVETTDPARLLDSDIAPALPKGRDALVLRRLAAEIEMWLHASAINEARERAGLPRISALWLWGGGVPPGAEKPPGTGTAASIALHGGDGFLAGLAHFANGPTPGAAPSGFAALDRNVHHHVVELTPMCGGPHESLAALESSWFAPMNLALSAGTLPVLEIVANDQCFRVTPRSAWRLWRPRRNWIANLARRPHSRRA